MSGFFLMHRGWRDNPVFGSEFSRADAWVWMIENTCWKPTKFDIAGKTVTLQRGQFCTSRALLAKAWAWSPSAVERFLTRLKTEQMIEQATGQGRSIITICNYEKYQAASEKAGQATGQATGQQSDSDRTAKEQGNKGTREDTDVSSPNAPAKHASGEGWPTIPAWVPVEPWNGFIEMRRRKKANPTARAVTLLLKELEELKQSGCDPGAVLDQSTKSNWTDVYRLKDGRNGKGSETSPRDNRDGFTRALHDAAGVDVCGDVEPPCEAERRYFGDGGSDGIRLIAGTAANR